MLDRVVQKLLAPVLQAAGRGLVRAGWGANALTVLGFALGMAAAVAIANQAFGLGLGLLLASRLMDGLDGTVARLTRPTDAGGFLDIALDFLFYAAIPLAFALADPVANALPAAVLLTSFIGTGSSFLAFAVLAARRGLASTAFPQKGFYYLGGLTESTETMATFTLMCVLPGWFGPLAYGFAALCGLTTVTRIVAGVQAFGGPSSPR
jgi:phosphatidylglycerophosphate synthase